MHEINGKTSACQTIVAIVCLAMMIGFVNSQSTIDEWRVDFTPNKSIKLRMGETQTVNASIHGSGKLTDVTALILQNDHPSVVAVPKLIPLANINHLYTEDTIETSFNVTGVFLGDSMLSAAVQTNVETVHSTNSTLRVIVIRQTRIIDTVFIVCVALLGSLLYVNFGAALDLENVREIARAPIGPILGLIAQFVYMPLLSYGLGLLLFPDRPDFQLGLFFTGISPAGGASNIWSVILNGNLNLSITMTSIGNFAAFLTIPLWTFILGERIFDKVNIETPYRKIATTGLSLFIPLVLGILIQIYLPRLARALVRVLKTVSALLIIFIIVFAIVANMYIFQLFSWQIVLAGLLLPLLGFTFGGLAPFICARLPFADRLTIAIETGVQNTGIAIYLLQFTLSQPSADLTTIIPVSVATMTPLPLFLFYIGQKIKQKYSTIEEIR